MKKTLQEVREYINEGVYDPGIFKAFFLAGGPGSGKTFVTQSAFAGTGFAAAFAAQDPGAGLLSFFIIGD